MSVHAEHPVAAVPVAPVASKPLASEFTFTRWSLRDEPRLALGAIVPVALLGTATALTTNSTIATTLVVLAMIAANWPVFLPIRYTLDAAGIERRCGPWRRRISWSVVGHCDFSATGARLFRNPHPAPLDLLGCAFIPWGQHREVVVAHLRRRLAVATHVKPVSEQAATGNDETTTAIDGLGRPGAER